MSSLLPLRRAAPAACLLLSLLLFPACEENVTPVLGTERAFTLYGVLSPDLDEQSILVYPVEGTLRPHTPEPLDATITSTDLTTGEVRVWHDSVTVDSEGLYEHVFWSDFRAEYSHRYRIEAVRNSDKRTSSVEIEVPPRVEVTLEAPSGPPFVIQPIRISGGAPRLTATRVDYLIRPYIEGGQPQADITMTIPYANKEVKSGTDWLINVDLSGDYQTIRTELNRREIRGSIVLHSIRVYTLVANEEWNPPGGVFNPEVLVEPGVMTNVENGFGFVTGGFAVEQFLFPSRETVRAAGFVDPGVLPE